MPRSGRTLAKAGVLSAALPEAAGGAGLGLLEQCSVLIEIGRTVAPVPYLASIVLGASAVAEFGSSGSAGALARPGRARRADPRGGAGRGGWRGRSRACDGSPPYGRRLAADRHQDDRARWHDRRPPAGPREYADGPAVFVVAPADAGVSVQPQHVTGGDATALVELTGALVPDDRVLGGVAAGREVVDWLVARATVALCALQLGVTERALELTAAYARSREQFGKPIGSFQAVSQRLADGVHRHRGDPAHPVAGRLAASRRAAERDRGRDGQVLGGRGRAPGRAHRRPHPRRSRHRPGRRRASVLRRG